MALRRLKYTAAELQKVHDEVDTNVDNFSMEFMRDVGANSAEARIYDKVHRAFMHLIADFIVGDDRVDPDEIEAALMWVVPLMFHSFLTAVLPPDANDAANSIAMRMLPTIHREVFQMISEDFPVATVENPSNADSDTVH